MIEKFLKAKHWQIFMITFGLPFLIQIIAMPMTIAGNDPMIMMKTFPIIMILFTGGFLGWFWSIGVGLQNKVPTNVTMKVKKFKAFLIIPLIYILLISLSLGSMFKEAFEAIQEPRVGLMGGMVGIIFPLHLFSMFCLFYCLYFVTKTLKTVELQREVSFADFAGEFFLIWFFPVGIWIVQPKINKMIENNV
ncbi:MAG: hypothetical protein R6W78_04865 [Bacteroidales bacterium]